MKRILSFALLLMTFTSALAQIDTTNIAITNFRLVDGTFNWRGTNTFFDKTNFDSSPYTEGHLREVSTNRFRQNFRLLTPQGYDPNYSPGYPLMIVWHGAVERANCFLNPTTSIDNCYYGDRSWRPHVAPIPTGSTDLNNLLNNDHQLLHGADYPHLSSWRAAGTRKIDDPALPVRAFPGFVVFPQNLNGWGGGDIRDALRIVRLLMKKYNIDPDRVYTHGLSNGGHAVQQALVEAPWLFASAAVMSPIVNGTFRNNAAKVSHIPMWFFQGGKDEMPTPQQTETTIRIFRQAGGSARYTFYPNLNHGTWNTAYREPDFISWFLGNTNSNIHIAYGSATICGTNGEPAKLSLPAGFFTYQWERNGVIIPGANTNVYMADQPGVYRARYSRVSATPSESEWNRWSAPVTVTELTPEPPVITQINSIHLRDLNGNNQARLSAPAGFTYYYWEKDGQPTSISPNQPNPTINAGTNNVNMGRYTVRTARFDNCPSEPSNVKAVFFGNLAPVNIPRPTNFTGTLTGPTAVLLRWNDVSGLERHYEIWRRRSTDSAVDGWTFVALTAEDVVQYEDKGLLPGTEYWYKIRAVSNEGRSDYSPGNNKETANQNLIIRTEADNTPPAPPQNLTARQHDTDIATRTVSLELNWSPTSDAGGLAGYEIQYGTQRIAVPADQTSYILEGLPLNQTFGFRVVARDIAGNVSEPSNQVSANTYIDGLFWQHSTAAYTNIRDIAESTWSDAEFFGRSANLTLEPALQEEFLLFRFYGYIYINTPGQYQIRMQSNDGVELFLNGQSIIRRPSTVNDGTCATTNTAGNAPFTLAAGIHTVEVRYFQFTGTKCLAWQWFGPDANPANPTGWVTLPNNRIRSYLTPPEQVVPPAPTGLQAVANGMTQIDLSWNFEGTPDREFEIYRSTSSDGTFAVVGRTAEMMFSDQNLLPATTYFYKLKTVTSDNSSPFSETVSATTEEDTEPPTQPTALTLFTQTLTTASIAWTKSEDNTRVIGYEIWVNDVLHSTAPSNFHLIEGLEPLRTYSVYVVAYDPNGNKSEPSNTITFDTSTPAIFYSKATGALNELASWGRNANGTGDAPLNFGTNGTYFVIANRTETQVGGNWKVDGNVSKIVVPAGVTLTAESHIQGRLEVQDGGTLAISNANVPTLINLGVNSTVQYNQAAQQIQRSNYGNLVLSGTGNKTFPSGTTIVYGNLTAANGIAIKGVSGNNSTVVLYNDVNYVGSPAYTPSEVGVVIEMRKGGNQNLNFAGKLDLHQIRTTPNTVVTVSTGENPGTLMLGSAPGGGLLLEAGSSLQLGNNTLQLIGAATINPGNQTGVIHVNGGSIDITSSSGQNSNLYFDASENVVEFFRSNLSGSGTAVVQSPLNIVDGLKIVRGTFNANGLLTLVSTSTKTANLQAIENNGRVIGDVNVQRYISQKARTYRYMSSPVAGTKVSNWQEFFAITGPFEGTSRGTGLSTQHSLFVREQQGWVGYPASTMASPYNNKDAPIERGRGYAAFVRNTTEVRLLNKGVPHQGTVEFNVHGPNENILESEWNLLGNPYASTIAWTNNAAGWTKRNIANIVAVRDNLNTTSGRFQYYDAVTQLGTGEGTTLAGGRIAQGQAFWVQATGANPAISIHEPAKSTGQQDFYREGISEFSHVKLRLSMNEKADQALVVFTDFGTDNLDKNFDGLKMTNEGLFNIATVTSDGATVAINNVNDSFCSKRIGISVKNVSQGAYHLEVPSPETLAGVGALQLVDHFTGTSVDLLQSNSYVFNVTADPATYGDGRFELVFDRPALDLEIKSTVAVHCAESAEVQLREPQRGASYSLVSLNGVRITDEQTSDGSDLTFRVPTTLLKEGLNNFNVQASFKGCSSAMLASSVMVEYYAPPTVTAANVAVCEGSAATLRANSNGTVAHYEWYTAGALLKGANEAVYVTGPVTEEISYLVNAVTPSGCRGPQFVITVMTEPMDEPAIMVIGDSLISSIAANEYTWMLNGEVIANSPDAYYITADKPGEYTVTLKSGDCLKSSRPYLVTGVVNENRIITQLYPNPTTSDNINLTLKLRQSSPVEIDIVDAIGRTVYLSTFQGMDMAESIQIKPEKSLRAGVYILTVKHNSHTEKIKFIIKE